MPTRTRKKTPRATSGERYFVLQPVMRGGMLLAPLVDAPGDQGWTEGVRFDTAPTTPVVAKIRAGYEAAEPREFLGVPPIMSERLAKVVAACGVTNVDFYDAVLRSSDGKTVLRGYKAFNLVGLVAAADMRATRFAASNPSRSTDASIESLAIDPEKTAGRLMFRLEENTSTIVVHDAVRTAIENAGIANVLFVEPSEHIT